MPKTHAHHNGALGPIKVFDGQLTTGEVSVMLEVPCRYFAVQMVKTSTSATLVVTGHLAPSSLSTAGVTLLSFAATTSTGILSSTESTGALGRLSFNHAAGASSGLAGLSAWLTASP